MSRSAKPQNVRRRFLRDVVRTAGGLAAVGFADIEGADIAKGTLNGVPAVM
ncbi:hypothetical protein AB2908_24940, partial [Escherichia coli]